MNSRTETTSQLVSEETKDIFQRYSHLSTDEKLALLYFIYEDMGDSITPAAPGAANPQFAPMLLKDFFSLSDEDQLAIMREIANGEETEYSRAYGALTANDQLLVWYVWAEGMGDTVVGLPDDYKASADSNDVLARIGDLEFESQISLLREIASKMGYSEVEAVPTQAETGKTPSL
ncbi:MAG: orange carotenoid protein N-terminal domain-containing protein [Cyanobacteriota bacterium]|nr:orange carotenoid protein N-terminal domain-containing protein [Cyanobacteriota bacterium]